jgi:hypothetical protein
MSKAKWAIVLLVILAGICIGALAIGRTSQMQAGHNQGIVDALENAGIKPTSSSPSR